MLYAILAYHPEGAVESWTREEDEARMDKLLKINDRLVAEKHLGSAARLGRVEGAKTLRGPGDGMVIDGPSPRPRSNCWASISWTTPRSTTRSRSRVNCAAPTPPPSTKSVRSRSICRERSWRKVGRGENKSLTTLPTTMEFSGVRPAVMLESWKGAAR
jgi:hypothetical protein